MTVIFLETHFEASAERVFDLVRDVSVHPQTTGKSKERVVESSAQLLELGDTVTFEAVHFGIKQRLSSRIVEYEYPVLITDQMTRGAFKSLVHRRELSPRKDGVLMVETLTIEAPLGPVGRLVEWLFLARYMKEFLKERNRELRRIAEVCDGGKA